MKVRFGYWLTVIKLIGVVDLALAVVVGIICWFAGWRSINIYAMALMLAGTLTLGIVGISAISSTSYIADPIYLLARSVESKPLDQRIGEDLKYIRDSWNSITLIALMSLGLVGLGLVVWLLGNLFR